MPRFRHVARDEEANVFPHQFRVWETDGYVPDLTAEHFSGLKSGHRPLLDVKAYQFPDGYNPISYLMPDPLTWFEAKKVLPTQMAGSQLGILFDGYSNPDGYDDGYDGYNTGHAYLFGHHGSPNIYRARLNNPADWFLVGTLPNPLSYSQLAVIDGYVADGYALDGFDGYQNDGYLYMFGGVSNADGYSATNHIFSATTSHPLNWTDQGAKLPAPLSHSQLIMLDGYIWLFGGKQNNAASNVIYHATIDNPLLWTDTLAALPVPLHSSHVAILDGYAYLFGGFTTTRMSDAILRAPIFDLRSWSNVGTMPFPCASEQFVRVGNKGYLICATNSQTTPTKILSCNIGDPLTWADTGATLPGEVSEGQLAIIYDRLFLMGGSGNSAIFSCDQILKPDFGNTTVISYGNITRTQIEAEPNKLEWFEILGTAPWKTDYR